ncbi:MAG: ABC transporter permease, partial [Chloroflexi bacterium]|nr:ABC transporter permease [Chloroflexota bacterium]
MVAYLIRRIFQMVIVLFFVALATYLLLSLTATNIMPGGESQRKITAQEVALIRAKYELDFYFPFRFSRWLTGLPDGPITIGGRSLFQDVPVGCYMVRAQPPSCDQYLYLKDIPQYHPAIKSSKGIIRGDFGLSGGISKGRPAWEVIKSRLRPTLELSILSLIFSL